MATDRWKLYLATGAFYSLCPGLKISGPKLVGAVAYFLAFLRCCCWSGDWGWIQGRTCPESPSNVS
jgi:hypothetical protein